MARKMGYGSKIMAVGLVCCLMLGGTAGLAEVDVQSEALKSAMESLTAADSMTVDAQFAVRQNSEDVMTGSAVYQFDGTTKYASAQVAHGDGETRDLELSASGDTCTVRVGDEFYAVPIEKADEAADETGEPAPEVAEEPATSEKGTADYLSTVREQLFGSVSSNLAISDTGVELHLAGDEVPAILNLAVSIMSSADVASMVSDATSAAADDTAAPAILHGTRGATQEAEVVKAGLSLGSQLHIERADMTVAIESGTISGAQLSIVLIGTDAEGAQIETELAIVLRITNVGATVPAAIDMSGVEMKPMQTSGSAHPWLKR